VRRLSRPPLRFPRARLCVMLAASVAGCTASMVENMPSVPGLTPYRIEIQQGNFVSQDMIAKLKRGMSREQVRFVLGTPLLTDVFHPDRWDYVFYRQRPDKSREERRISVFFENNRLLRITGDVVPETAARPGAAPKGGATNGATASGATASGAAVKDEVAKDESAKDEAAKGAAVQGEAAQDDTAGAPLERAGEQAK
jgi:outer membrane protein assembly factor BamE